MPACIGILGQVMLFVLVHLVFYRLEYQWGTDVFVIHRAYYYVVLEAVSVLDEGGFVSPFIHQRV